MAHFAQEKTLTGSGTLGYGKYELTELGLGNGNGSSANQKYGHGIGSPTPRTSTLWKWTILLLTLLILISPTHAGKDRKKADHVVDPTGVRSVNEWLAIGTDALISSCETAGLPTDGTDEERALRLHAHYQQVAASRSQRLRPYDTTSTATSTQDRVIDEVLEQHALIGQNYESSINVNPTTTFAFQRPPATPWISVPRLSTTNDNLWTPRSLISSHTISHTQRQSTPTSSPSSSISHLASTMTNSISALMATLTGMQQALSGFTQGGGQVRG